jgi:hypothetical protein
MSASDFETRLRQALAPVDPPADLELRMEQTLGEIVELAADELEAWELTAFKDPRNWVRIARPAAAIVLGTGAAVGLVVLRTQRKRHRRRAQARGALDLVDRTLRDFGREALRVFDDVR